MQAFLCHHSSDLQDDQIIIPYFQNSLEKTNENLVAAFTCGKNQALFVQELMRPNYDPSLSVNGAHFRQLLAESDKNMILASEDFDFITNPMFRRPITIFLESVPDSIHIIAIITKREIGEWIRSMYHQLLREKLIHGTFLDWIQSTINGNDEVFTLRGKKHRYFHQNWTLQNSYYLEESLRNVQTVNEVNLVDFLNMTQLVCSSLHAPSLCSRIRENSVPTISIHPHVSVEGLCLPGEIADKFMNLLHRQGHVPLQVLTKSTIACR
jgi:hypothetical protein